ncbi:MAG TPA: sodium/solute symporter, partial [Bryobacteraceae bacterium]
AGGDPGAGVKLNLAPIDIAVFVIYLLVVLAIGFFAARRGKRTKRDYFLAGDKLPWWMVGGSIVASNISSHHLIGVMGTAYNRGAVALVIEWGAILIGFNALLWIFLPFYLRNGFYTVPEFLYRRFGPSARVTYAVLILMTYLFVEIGAVLYMGALAFYSLVGIPISWSIGVLAVATGLYTIAGGLRAVVWTEMLQLVVLLLGGIALAIATIHAVGGLGVVAQNMKSWHLLLPASDPDFPWTQYLGSSLCISIFYCAANQFIVQRALAAKDEWHARMGVVFTDYLKFFMPLVIIVPGLMAPLLFPRLEKSDLVFPTLVEHLLPHGMVGLVMAGLIAAVMGHTSGAINSCTTIATIDFYLPYKRWKASEKPLEVSTASGSGQDIRVSSSAVEHVEPEHTSDAQAVSFGRITGIFVILIGIVCAELLTRYSTKPIFIFLLEAYGYFTPGIATMFLLGIFWKRTTTAGALSAGIMTIPLSLTLKKWIPRLAFQNRAGIVFWTCMATCALVSLCTQAPRDESLRGLIWTPDSLRLPADQRQKYRGVRNPFVWWALITGVVLFFYIRFA